MPRTLQPTTPLARLILQCGKPAYVVAAEVPVNHNRFLDYCAGRVDISRQHLIRLAEYFEVTPAAILGGELPDSTAPVMAPEPTFELETWGSVAELRATPGAKHVTVFVTARENAWALRDAPPAPLVMWARQHDSVKEESPYESPSGPRTAYRYVTMYGPWERVCDATVEKVRSAGTSTYHEQPITATLRVPSDESDAVRRLPGSVSLRFTLAASS
jgi:hypothetical protein